MYVLIVTFHIRSGVKFYTYGIMLALKRFHILEHLLFGIFTLQMFNLYILICQCNLITQSEQTITFPFFMHPDIHSNVCTHIYKHAHTYMYMLARSCASVPKPRAFFLFFQGFLQLCNVLRPFSGHFNFALGIPKLFRSLGHFYFS